MVREEVVRATCVEDRAGGVPQGVRRRRRRSSLRYCRPVRMRWSGGVPRVLQSTRRTRSDGRTDLSTNTMPRGADGLDSWPLLAHRADTGQKATRRREKTSAPIRPPEPHWDDVRSTRMSSPSPGSVRARGPRSPPVGVGGPGGAALGYALATPSATRTVPIEVMAWAIVAQVSTSGGTRWLGDGDDAHPPITGLC